MFKQNTQSSDYPTPAINPNANLYVEYSVTLFYNDQSMSSHGKASKRGFFGRTYVSDGVPLVQMQTMGNLYEANEEHFIYLNTNATNAVFVIEIILVKEENNRAERASAGYAMIPIPDSKDLHNSQM